MFGISYYYSKDGVLEMEFFHTEEECKLWFIDELFKHSILHYWFDGAIEDNDDECPEYYEAVEIRNCLLKTDLPELIKKLKHMISIDVKILKKD